MNSSKSSIKQISISVIFIFTVILVSIYLNMESPNIPDADSLYHFGHAEIYRTGGIWQNEFPWVQNSVINSIGADIWYGFHILLIPFTLINDKIYAIKLAGISETALVILTASLAIWKLDKKRLTMWLCIFISSSSIVLLRLIMLRPHPLSLALSLLLFAALVSPTQLVVIFALGFFIAWSHLALAWVPIVIYLAVLASEIVMKIFDKHISDIKWQEGAALLGGIILGIFARPNAFGALKIAYVQVADLLAVKQSKIPLQFGGEIDRLHFADFARELWPFLILLLLTLISLLFYYRRSRGRQSHASASLLASFCLSALFFYLSFFVAQRSLELFVGFAILFVIIAMRVAISEHNNAVLKTLAAFFILIQIGNTLPRFNTYLPQTTSPDLLKASALWLKDNAKEKAVVFNANWDIFAPLFFWNPNNYYINGMDPIFEYSFDKSLYWKTHYYATGALGNMTCGKRACMEEDASSTDDVLRNDFKASYVALQKQRIPKLYDYLDKSKGYKKVFENLDEAVFEVLPIPNRSL